MTLVTWRGVIGHNIPTQGVNSTSNPIFESVLNVFCSKEAPFVFLQFTMERSQNWPDLRSPISKSKFWDKHFIDTLACSNRWKFQGNRLIGVALRNIQTFYEMRSLDVTWWPDLRWPGSKIFREGGERMPGKVCQKWLCPILKQLQGGCFKHPHTLGRRLTDTS